MDEGLNPENLMNLDEWGEINPQWEEMIEKSGASDKIQNLPKCRWKVPMYMSTFAMLQIVSVFPIFQLVYAFWYRKQGGTTTFRYGAKIADNGFSEFKCNVQFRPLFLLPERIANAGTSAQHDETVIQGKPPSKWKRSARTSPSLAECSGKNISKHYVQDLFRFFKLNPHHGDFTDMFSTSLIMHKTYLFDLLSIDDTLKSTSQNIISQKLYPQALELFEEINKEGEISAALYQKMGYTYQQTSRLNEALDAYKGRPYTTRRFLDQPENCALLPADG